MDEQDKIAQAEREAHRDRPRDALSLVCAVLVAQHQAIEDLTGRLKLAEQELDRLREPW